MSQNLINASVAMLEALGEVDHILGMLVPGLADNVYAARGHMERALLEQRIHDLAEHGEVVVVESGRDCDGVEYRGRCHTIQATLDAYIKLDDEIGQWADGPYRLNIVSPSQAESISYSSRDLVMEAYEDGHPHYIVSSF